MEIKLNSLKIKNFKGIKQLDLKFEQITNIYAENGVGKTSIQDAFTFLLFDKDSKNKANFKAQPLDKDGNQIHNLETIIVCELEIDGVITSLKRLYKEKYTKIKGTGKVNFKGYENKYYINDTPKKVGEYKKYIEEILDEEIFKLITNPLYFSSLKWQTRKEIVHSITGNLDNIEVIKSNKELDPLKNHLKNTTLNDFRKATREKIRVLKKDREQIPSRIDELVKSNKKFDFEALEIQKRTLVSGIKSIDEKILDKSKFNSEHMELKKLILTKQYELEEIKYKLKIDANKPIENLESKERLLVQKIKHSSNNIVEYEKEIKSKQALLKSLEAAREYLLRKYKEIKSSKINIDPNNFICPTCKRKLDQKNIDEKKKELIENFNLEKANKIEINIRKGKQNAADKEEIADTILLFERNIKEEKRNILLNQDALEGLKNKLKELKNKNISKSDELENINREIKELKNKLNDFKVEDTTELTFKKSKMNEEIEFLNSKLAYKEINEANEKRIEELENEETNITEKITELEKLEILSDLFIREKVNLLEEKVNKYFKLVKFKMFNKQVNGGLEECCEPCVDGVPFTENLNDAARINAGLDIINTLSKHYKVSAPIFIDNRESTNRIIDIDSQIINLIVSKDKSFKIEYVHIPTEEEKKELEDIVYKIQNNFNGRETSLDDIEGVPDEFCHEGEEYGDKARWWQYKYIYYSYKGQHIVFSCQEPLTEQQEGQDTDPRVEILETVRGEI